MIILMKKNATEEEIGHVSEWITSVGYQIHLSRGVERTIIGAIGVSGAPTGDADDSCAKAGIAAIKDELEF